MRPLFSPRGLRVLRESFNGKGPPLIGFDFDGTLAPLVRDPLRARMRRLTRARLARLADSAPVAVISGRRLEDLEPRVSGLRLVAVVGSHGIEPFFRSKRLAARALRWHRAVGPLLEGIPEVRVEYKRYGFAVHYRGAHRPALAKRRIQRVLAGMDDMRIMWGSRIADIVPLGAPAKNDGLERIRRRTGARQVIYVGDDTTDEDVFRAGIAEGWLTIRVGEGRETHARYYVRKQQEIDRLLSTLIDLTTRSSSEP
ncbi:MAG TPA: trehalose-phosphatase [Gemmatimonadaceae bacterium]|nr:trehalose-phosphatase [Gemmatimonadaceae bacterium]